MSEFEWSEKESPLLLNDDDLAYLELSDKEMNVWDSVFSGYDFTSPQNVLNSVIDYSYKNWMFAAKIFLGLELAPFQGVVLDYFFNKNFMILVGSRGFGKSMLLAIYAVLKAIFEQGSNIVVVSASFRQSQVIFNYILEKMYKASPVLQQISSPNSPKKDISMCSYRIGKSIISCVPLGNGDKIRGLRASCVDGNTLISTNYGLIAIKETEKYIGKEDFKVNTGNGSYVQPEYFMKTKPIDGYYIKTELGFSLMASEIHGVYTENGIKNVKNLKIGDKIIMDYNQDFPDKIIEHDGLKITKDVAWLIGVLISEGYINKEGEVGVTNTDFEFLEKTKKMLEKVFEKENIRVHNKSGYTDKRGWGCKPSKYVCLCNMKIRNKLERLGLKKVKAREKTIPWAILQSPKEVIVEFLSGLFEGDGSCYLYKDKKTNNNLGITYYTGSKDLARELHVLLSRFGIVGSLSDRASKISEKRQYFIRYYGLAAHRLYKLLNIKKWDKTYEECRKDVRFIENCKKSFKIKQIEKLREKQCFYDYTIPNDHSFVGNGIKNRNCILVDEMASVPSEIFEVVIRGFSVVSNDPIKKMKERARQKQLIRRGHDVSDFKVNEKSNQIILSGTAYYQFNHFYKKYSDYLEIIKNYNNRDKLRSIMGGEVTDEELENLDPRKFCTIKVPSQYLPNGFMDETIIAQGRATMTKAHFEMEFGAVFYADSDGFYPRSLIDALAMFRQYPAKLHGEKTKEYIMGVDPARQSDHFSITIIELDKSDDRRNKIVYCWATNEKKMKQSGEVNENQTYYGACARKIRQLMDRFNIVRIMIDAGGGGREIANYLQEKQFLKDGEKPVWDVEDIDQAYYEGLHIMRLIPSNVSWSYEANHSMKKSFEEFKLLFPTFDTVAIEKEFNEIGNQISIEKMIKGVRYAMTDTLEDVSEEIEEMKNEISNIVVTATATGNEHFDLPKLEGTQKGKTKDKRRKDRYSSCLLAHYGIKEYLGDEYETNETFGGGTKEDFSKNLGLVSPEEGSAIILNNNGGTVAY